MISEVYAKNLDTLRRAAKDGALCVVVSKNVATQEPLALVACAAQEGREIVLSPFGYLAEKDLIAKGALTPRARALFEVLVARLKDDSCVGQFRLNGEEHAELGFSQGENLPSNEDFLMVMAWDNPFELFAAPDA